MYLDNNNHFYGKINGKSIGSFLKFNYNLNTCEERIDFINEVLEMYKVDGVEFYNEYFDEVYDQDRKFGKIDIVIGKDKSQYTESNIASALEMIANYILAVDEKDDSINYKIYTSEELFNRACREYNVINSVAKANGGLDMNYGENIIEAFPIFQLPKNFKKVKDLKVEKKDLEKYPPMKDYTDFYEYLKEESKRLWNTKGLSKEDMVRRSKIKKMLPEIKKDIIEVKKQLQMPIIWKAPLKDNGGADYDELDMFDKMNIKVRDNLYTDMDMIIFNYESDNKEIKCAKCNCDKIYSHKNNFDIVNAVDETLEELLLDDELFDDELLGDELSDDELFDSLLTEEEDSSPLLELGLSDDEGGKGLSSFITFILPLFSVSFPYFDLAVKVILPNALSLS